MRARRSLFAKLVASLLIAACFAALLHAGGLPLWPPAEALQSVEWWGTPAYLALWCVVHVLRAARWQLLLAPLDSVPMRRVLGVSFIGFAAIVLLPFRAGEVVRPYLIRTRGSVSGWAATGTIAAERIIDGLFLTIMLAVAMAVATPLAPLPDRIGSLPISAAVVPGATYFALGLFTCAFVAMGAFYFQRALAERLTRTVLGLVSPRLAAWFAERVEKVASGLGFLPRPSLFVPFVLATAAYWMLNCLATWALARAVGLDAFRYSEACVVTGVLALGILVPNAPGFFGAFQFSTYAALALYYPVDVVLSAGAAYVLYVYVLQLVVTLGAAGLGLLSERPSTATELAPTAADLED